MALVIKKSTQLVGQFKIGEELVKQVTVEIDDKGISKVNEWLVNEGLYAGHRKEMRRQEKEFRDKRYEIEDEILAELETQDAQEAGERTEGEG